MKRLLLAVFCVLGFQIQSDAVVVNAGVGISSVPYYYTNNALDFSINWGVPLYCECESCYPYCCRNYYFTNSIYINTVSTRPYYHRYSYVRYVAPPPPPIRHHIMPSSRHYHGNHANINHHAGIMHNPPPHKSYGHLHQTPRSHGKR